MNTSNNFDLLLQYLNSGSLEHELVKQYYKVPVSERKAYLEAWVKNYMKLTDAKDLKSDE